MDIGNVVRCLSAHSVSLPLISFGPLSALIMLGLPRYAIIWSKAQITRSDGKEKSSSMYKVAVKVIDDIK